MISDEERREAAAWLRGEIGSGYYCPGSLRMSEAFGVPDPKGPGYTGRLLGRLADLIEPSEPKVKCVAEVKVDGERLESLVHDAAVELTGIDRDALLALANELDARALELLKVNSLDQSRKRRSIRRMHAMDLMASCSRIREALGVGR